MPTELVFLFRIHMHVKKAVAELCGRDALVVFEELDKFVFVIKAALQGDLLDRVIGVDEERFDVLGATLDDGGFGVVSEFALKNFGKMVGAIAEMTCHVKHGEGAVGVDADKFCNFVGALVAVFCGLTKLDQKLGERDFCQGAVAFLQVHQLGQRALNVECRRKMLGEGKALDAIGVKMKPIKGGEPLAFCNSAVLSVRLEQKQISRVQEIFLVPLRDVDFAVSDENKFKGIDRCRRMDPLGLALEKPHIGKIQLYAV